MDVGVMTNGYKPWTFEEVYDRLNARYKEIDPEMVLEKLNPGQEKT